MKTAKWIAFGLTIASGLFCLLPWIISKIFLNGANISGKTIGIIGGADGPTAFFVADKVESIFIKFMPVIFIISIISWAVLFIKCKKSK